ncbi:unnamed protein product [Linum tenue]|uniref:Uncharacterized protein n=1 Tax=Linum tenue TaxID=586396 RepID=A0AAV0QYH6_9ROSI|nr:unnamed protein product [Linum tenue]
MCVLYFLLFPGVLVGCFKLLIVSEAPILPRFAMSLLEVITRAATNSKDTATGSEYPIILNPDETFLNLKPQLETPNATVLVSPVSGWQPSQTDTKVIEISKKFHPKLKRKLKDTNSFTKEKFITLLKPFLEEVREILGLYVAADSANDADYACALLRKIGFFMGQDVASLVLEASLKFEIWDMVETLIVNRLVGHSCYSSLVESLISRKRSDILCLCIKYATDLGLSELTGVVKYFLCPSREAYNAMADVRKEWESQALTAIDKASDMSLLDNKKSRLAKEAAVLLMLAYDGFSTSELCLHYLLASSNIDEVIMSAAISKLNGRELMSLVRYLGKWLKKYERFPEAVPCPKASNALGLKACAWVPKLDDIVRCFGLVVDENFSTLILHTEFHEELKAIKEYVGSLASEAPLCSSVATSISRLRSEAKGEQSKVLL